MERILHRRLDRLVVLGERAVDHAVAEEPADPLAVHDERQVRVRIFGIHGGRVVGHVANPLRAVPADARPLGIPRRAVEVGGGAVVQDTTVQGPAPRPVGVEAHPGGVVGRGVLDSAPPLHQVSGVRIRACVDPVPGGRRAVVLQVCERRHLLSGGQVLAVDLLGDLVQVRLERVFVAQGHRIDRVRELAALLLVEVFHPAEEVGQDPVVVPRVALRWNHLVLPLRPPAAVRERSVLFDPVGGREHEHLCLDLARVDTGRVPELGARRRQRVHHD